MSGPTGTIITLACMGSVYLIGNDANSLVKIGMSGAPKTRLRELQTGSPVRLELLRVYDDQDGTLESWLHAQFRERHAHGEWFALGRRYLKHVDEAVACHQDQVRQKSDRDCDTRVPTCPHQGKHVLYAETPRWAAYSA